MDLDIHQTVITAIRVPAEIGVIGGSVSLSGGHGTAITNMTAVTEHFGASPCTFIIVPLIGAFFIDIANAVIIQMVLDRIT